MPTKHKVRAFVDTEGGWNRVAKLAARLTLDGETTSRGALIRRFIREGLEREEVTFDREAR